jgi:hypothetical protein
MSSEKINEHVNIYLNNNEVKEHILKDSTPYEKYIICMNEKLQVEVSNQNDNIRNLKNDIKELENEVDTYDTSKRYTKGLLKNLVEIEKMSHNILQNKEKCVKDTLEIKKKCYENNKFYLRIFEALAAVLISLSINMYVFDPEIIFMIFYSLLVFPLLEIFNNQILIMEFESLDVKTENEELSLKIKKIRDSQDFLSEYIDNL